MDRVVLHVDMDAFFAAVHEREDPELAGGPLVIGADPQGGRGRGVACTANYAARAYGIRSAMPIGEAYRRCPHATFIRPRRGLYRPASEEVMAILSRYADVLQVVGVDEAYLDMTQCTGGDFGEAHNLARSMQAAITRETSLSCSIGIAPSKSVAKIASDHRKPHGITLVTPADVDAFLDPLPVALINGCGPKTAARLQEWDIRTIGDLARTERGFLEGRFGSHGAWIHDIACGIDPRAVQADRGPAKSRSNERTYLRDCREADAVRQQALRLLAGLLDARDRRAFSTLTVKIRYADFTTLTRSHTLSVPLDPDNPETPHLAAATVESLLGPLLEEYAVRLVGVRLSGFSDTTGQRALTQFGLGRAHGAPQRLVGVGPRHQVTVRRTPYPIRLPL